MQNSVIQMNEEALAAFLDVDEHNKIDGWMNGWMAQPFLQSKVASFANTALVYHICAGSQLW